MTETIVKSAVWKFPLELLRREQTIDVPLGSTVLHVHEQDDQICVWVQVQVGPYADAHPSQMRFRVVGTGDEFVSYERQSRGDWPNAGEIPTYAVHRGTAHLGWTVWHVYEMQNHPG